MGRPFKLLPGQIEAICEGYRQNRSATELAAAYGITTATLYKYLRFHGVVLQYPRSPRATQGQLDLETTNEQV